MKGDNNCVCGKLCVRQGGGRGGREAKIGYATGDNKQTNTHMYGQIR